MLLCENSKVWQFLYDVCTWFIAMLVLNYAGVQFYLLDGKLSLRVLKNTYCYTYILVIIGYVLMHFIPPYKPKDVEKKEK